MDNEDRIKKLAIADQARAELCETLVPMLYEFYSKCKESGFNTDEAMDLTLEYMRCVLTPGGLADG